MLRNLGADVRFAPLVVGACVTLWVVTLLMSGGGIGGSNILSALSPSRDILLSFGASGAYPVFGLGRWWTVLSAGWLHAGLLHVAMNMYWVWQMGPAITELFGPARTVIIYTAFGGVAGFALSSFSGRVSPRRAADSSAHGGYIHDRRLRACVRSDRRPLSLRPEKRGSQHSREADAVRRDPSWCRRSSSACSCRASTTTRTWAASLGGYLTSAFLNPMTRERGDHIDCRGRLSEKRRDAARRGRLARHSHPVSRTLTLSLGARSDGNDGSR